MTATTLPLGPQHPVLVEPLQLKLVLRDEVVQEALPRLGYVHRGLEGLVRRKDFEQMCRVAERVCGICSAIHGMTYCRALEALLGVMPPDRAEHLRVAWSELHRMQSHLLWLGLLAEAMGFESLFMQVWRVREKVMDLLELTAGNRVIVSVNRIGGVRRDVTDRQVQEVNRVLERVERRFRDLEGALLEDRAVRERLLGRGTISSEQALSLGLVGPTLRACGVAQDVRMTGYSAYARGGFEPVTETGGDCLARTRVRFREVLQSAGLVRNALEGLPEGDTSVRVRGKPEGEILVRAEQPRGEVVYYVRANGEKQLERMKIRTPTFANLAALPELLPGLELADVPLVLLSLDPCIACTER